MHAAQEFAYAFPNLDDPLFLSKLILEDDCGRIAMAALARLTCEMYLLVNREAPPTSRTRMCEGGVIPSESASEGSLFESRGEQDAAKRDSSGLKAPGMTTSPRGASRGQRKREEARARYAQLLALHRAGEQDLLARGLEDAHAWLPPTVARRFGRRLAALGWVRDDAWTPYSRRLSG